jgi:hypothetical protein
MSSLILQFLHAQLSVRPNRYIALFVAVTGDVVVIVVVAIKGNAKHE